MEREESYNEQTSASLHHQKRVLFGEVFKASQELKSSKIENNDSRIKWILSHLSKKSPSIILDPDVVSKSSKISINCRNEGNRYFKINNEGSLTKAFEEYTKSVAHAPPESHELSLAYANRSAALFKGKWFEDCLRDIYLALENNYPDDLKTKLYLRKASCLQALEPDDHEAINKAFTEAHQWLEKMPLKDQESMRQKLTDQQATKLAKNLSCYTLNFNDPPPKLRGENPTVPGLSDAVELRYNEEFGRHMVATRDIKPGEIIGTQIPYANTVSLTMRYKICWHCKKQTWSSLPCNTCSEVVFCSKVCRKKAQLDYHDVECSVLQRILAFGAGDNLILALRLTIMALKEAEGSVESLKNKTMEIDGAEDALTKGFTGGKLDPMNYASVYGLSYHRAHEIGFEVKVLSDSILAACFLSREISLTGDLNLEMLKENESFVYLLGLIEKNYLLVNSNTFSVTIPFSMEDVRISSAFSPSFGLFNHSCAPMMIHSFHGEHFVGTSLCPIQKGQQIFDCYGQPYFTAPKRERIKFLAPYNFVCKCEACVNDWPLSSNPSVKTAKNAHCLTKFSGGISQLAMSAQTLDNTASDYILKNNRLLDLKKKQADVAKIIDMSYNILEKNSLEIMLSTQILGKFIVLSMRRFFLLE